MHVPSIRMYESLMVFFVCLLLLVGCERESHVKITLLSGPTSGQEVSNTALEIVEGQAMWIRVFAVKKRTIKRKWDVSADARVRSIATIFEVKGADHENEFVVTGVSAGETTFEFNFRGRQVDVDVTVLPREDWEPSVDPYSFGGAGGFAGSVAD